MEDQMQDQKKFPKNRICLVALLVLVIGALIVLAVTSLIYLLYGTVYNDKNATEEPIPMSYNFSDFDRNMYCTDTTCNKAANEILNSLNTSVDPCDDFYNYACQGWLAQNPPSGYTVGWAAHSKMELQSLNLVIDILNDSTETEDLPVLSTAKRYYQKCLTAFTSEKEDMQFILDKLEDYGGWPILYEKGTWNNEGFNLTKTIDGLNTEFGIQCLSIDIDSFQNSSGENFETINSSSLSFMNTSTEELAVINFIVNVSTDLLEFLSGENTYDRNYLESKALEIVFVRRELQKFSTTSSDEALANYLLYRMVLEMSQLSGIKKFHEYVYTMKKAEFGLIGAYKDLPREVTCAREVRDKFALLLGHVYLKRKDLLQQPEKSKESEFLEAKVENSSYFNTTMDISQFEYLDYDEMTTYFYSNSSYNKHILKIHILFESILLEFHKLEHSTEDLDDEILFKTKSKVRFCPEYPFWILNGSWVQSEYSEVSFSEDYQHSASYMELSIEINKWVATKSLESETCKQRTLFSETGDTFINQEEDIPELYISQGMLQLPFYDPLLPASLNYGRLGFGIAHQLAHILFGHADLSEYANGTGFAECLVEQYNSYRLDYTKNANLALDGKLTLNENLADNAGIQAAYRAYKTYFRLQSSKAHQLTGLYKYTDDQLFYIGVAQTYCENGTETEDQYAMKTNGHTPGRFRVLGMLQNSPEFAQAWKCPLGSKMNPGPTEGKDKCVLDSRNIL